MKKTRKAWVCPTYFNSEGTTFVCYMEESSRNAVQVLVTDATDMPDFKPGDRVNLLGAKGDDGEVVGWPFRRLGRDEWLVPVAAIGRYYLWRADCLTKLPRETSVLLRVTGPEPNVGDFLTCAENWNAVKERVRVERVEDPDAKAER